MVVIGHKRHKQAQRDQDKDILTETHFNNLLILHSRALPKHRSQNANALVVVLLHARTNRPKGFRNHQSANMRQDTLKPFSASMHRLHLNRT